MKQKGRYQYFHINEMTLKQRLHLFKLLRRSLPTGYSAREFVKGQYLAAIENGNLVGYALPL